MSDIIANYCTGILIANKELMLNSKMLEIKTNGEEHM